MPCRINSWSSAIKILADMDSRYSHPHIEIIRILAGNCPEQSPATLRALGEGLKRAVNNRFRHLSVQYREDPRGCGRRFVTMPHHLLTVSSAAMPFHWAEATLQSRISDDLMISRER